MSMVGLISIGLCLFLIWFRIGAHIPDLSSEVEFFDVLHLGIFVILSPAFDDQFYSAGEPPSNLSDEIAYAVIQFHRLLHIFSLHFVILLEGMPVVCLPLIILLAPRKILVRPCLLHLI